MSIKIKNDKFIIYLLTKINIDFYNIDELEEYLKEIFLKLRKYSDKFNSGFFNINIYIDSVNGTIMEIEKEDIDYMIDEVDMKIIVHETEFLYEIDDILELKKILKKYEIYAYKNKYYLKNNNINYILEFSNLVYDTEEIFECGKKVSNML